MGRALGVGVTLGAGVGVAVGVAVGVGVGVRPSMVSAPELDAVSVWEYISRRMAWALE